MWMKQMAWKWLAHCIIPPSLSNCCTGCMKFHIQTSAASSWLTADQNAVSSWLKPTFKSTPNFEGKNCPKFLALFMGIYDNLSNALNISLTVCELLVAYEKHFRHIVYVDWFPRWTSLPDDHLFHWSGTCFYCWRSIVPQHSWAALSSQQYLLAALFDVFFTAY